MWRHHPPLRRAPRLVGRPAHERPRDLRAPARRTAPERPVALATVTAAAEGTAPIGAKLLVEPDGTVLGTLGDADLDRVVGRDALGELESGLTGPVTTAHGEAREDTVTVFVESLRRRPAW
ncbi:MAG: XdhC family protein [Acidimicrobiia bacterium]